MPFLFEGARPWNSHKLIKAGIDMVLIEFGGFVHVAVTSWFELSSVKPDRLWNITLLPVRVKRCVVFVPESVISFVNEKFLKPCCAGHTV